MKEVREILDRVGGYGDGDIAALATVVDLKGSGYRLPGARMLIEPDSHIIGTVSGGCLEADVMERAKRVIESRQAEIFTYDTTAEEDSVFSLNMGCRGVLRVLLEPFGRETPIIAKLNEAYSARRPVASAVLLNDHAGHRVGDRVFLDETIVDPSNLLTTIPQLADDLRTFDGSRSATELNSYEIEGDVVQLVFEMLRPPIQLIVFGAGADAVPLADAAHSLGWYTTVYDHRAAYLTHERFKNADTLIGLDRDGPVEIVADDLTAVVTMSHNYERDKLYLAAALDSHAFYVGALGPKKRTQQILHELGAAGHTFSSERLAVLRSPAGLDIGGDSPELIAVSIIAEIQSVLRGREGGPLRDRTAPIYDHD